MANGLLDFLKTPEGQGLLAATFGGLAGARPGAPLNTLGRAGLAGLSGYGGAVERQSMQQQQMDAKQLRDMQIQQMQQAIEQKQRDQGIFSQLTSPQVTPGRVDMNEMGLPVVGQAATSTPQKFDPMAALRQGMSPEAATRFAQIEQMSIPKKEVYKPGDVVYQGDKPVLTIPKEPTIPDAVRQFEYAQTNPAFAEYQKSLRRAGATQTNINMGQEKEEAKVVGKAFGEQFADIQKSGFTAQSTINRYDRLGQLLEGVNTGKFSPLGLEISKAAQAAGFNIDPNLKNKEASVALSNEIALQLRNPAGGAGMPGALSDKDREFLVSMVPGLGTTPEGRKMMLETGKKLAKRDMDVARLAREYRKKNGSLDEGFYDELNDYANKNPLFQQTTPKKPASSSVFDAADAILMGR